MKIFLICPVAKATKKINAKITQYVRGLEEKGHSVHWPTRDTEQDDPTGGVEINRTNFRAILKSDEVHVWYAETSSGSKFDMGGLFMLIEMLGVTKRVVIANEAEIEDAPNKSFFQVLKHLTQKF